MTFCSYSPQSLFPYTTLFRSNVTIQATDDYSGVSAVSVGWVSPDGMNFVGGGLSLSSGTNLNGTWTRDRKSTRLNSSHEWNSYAVVGLKKKGNYKFYYQSDLQ